MKRLVVCAVVAGTLSLVACEARQNAAGAAPLETTAAAPARTQPVQTLSSQLGPIRVTTLATGLEHPWAVALLPDGDFLVTERPGRLRRVAKDGTVSEPLGGVPSVFAEGQGGLLDVVLDPDFARNRIVWLSYAEPGPNGTAGTAVAKGALSEKALTDVRVVYRQLPKLVGPNHFGSRIAFDGKGFVFISQGERNDRPTAQKLDMLQGKLVRLHMDGSAPVDNPFHGRDDVRPQIWSYGHRNSQGLAIDPRTGTVWLSEHGPRGGDEINLPQPGKNYGWPLATHGINYSGLPIPEATGKEAPGTEPPHHVWEKSPALSGMAFFVNQPQSKWNDSLLLGALSDGSIIRLSLDGNRITGEERVLKELGARIRDVRVGGDGMVYAVTDEADGRLLRIEPPK